MLYFMPTSQRDDSETRLLSVNHLLWAILMTNLNDNLFLIQISNNQEGKQSCLSISLIIELFF